MAVLEFYDMFRVYGVLVLIICSLMKLYFIFFRLIILGIFLRTYIYLVWYSRCIKKREGEML